MRVDHPCLLQRLAFSKLRHFSWDNFPANTVAYDTATLSNPTKVGEDRAFPSLTNALFAANGDFPFTDGKTYCALNRGTY
jgi:hypothetical protein